MVCMSEDRGFMAALWDAANECSIRNGDGPITDPRPPEYKICVGDQCWYSREDYEQAMQTFTGTVAERFQIIDPHDR